MSTSETRSARPVPYGEFGGPFFDRETLEKIQKNGNRPVDLVGFMSAYGLHVITEKKDSLFDLLRSEKYGLGKVLKRTPQGGIIFSSKTILQVVHAMEVASMERQMAEAIVGGIDFFRQIEQWRQTFSLVAHNTKTPI